MSVRSRTGRSLATARAQLLVAALPLLLLAALGASCKKRSSDAAAFAVAAAPVNVEAPPAARTASSCLECEMKASHDPTGCPNTSPTAFVGTNDPAKFGCEGFAPADRAKCKAVLACVKAKKCANGSDPTPCLCGTMDAPTCSSKPVRSLPGACRDEYLAAAGSGDLYTLFFSTDSPVGVANNLYACEIDTPCACP